MPSPALVIAIVGCAPRATAAGQADGGDHAAAAKRPKVKQRRPGSRGAAGARPASQTDHGRNTKGSNTHDESTERERARRSPDVVDVAGGRGL
jgi:hypothetical protein